jgi:hypothetical protein
VYSHWDPRDDAALAEGPEPLTELVIEPGGATTRRVGGGASSAA